MKFDPMVDETPPEPAAPAEPNPMDAVNQQLADMRAQINATYQANKGIQPQPQVQYVPYPVAPQVDDEPDLDEASILADIPGSVHQIAERIAAEKERALREELGSHLGRFYEESYERTMKDLSAQPHYKYVEEELKEHFTKNPDERFQPGRVMEKYNALLGSKIAEIREAESKEQEDNSPARVRAVDHAVPVSSSSPSPKPLSKEEEEVKLSPEEEEERLKSNKYWGTAMGAKEWTLWRDRAPGFGPQDDSG